MVTVLYMIQGHVSYLEKEGSILSLLSCLVSKYHLVLSSHSSLAEWEGRSDLVLDLTTKEALHIYQVFLSDCSELLSTLLKLYSSNKPSITSLLNITLFYCPAVSFSPRRFFDFSAHHVSLIHAHSLHLFVEDVLMAIRHLFVAHVLICAF